jgi:hypothetical protein
MRLGSMFLAVAVGAVATLTGCARPKEPAWTAKPQVRWADVSTQESPPVVNGYRILQPLGSVGRFPASVAVSRLSIRCEPAILDQAAPQSAYIAAKTRMVRRPFLSKKPKNEFLAWNSTFDDQMAVSELFPIAQRDLGGGPADPLQIIAAFKALEAKLGIIYAVNEKTPNRTEMLGVLYETETALPLAAFHAHAVSIIPPEDEKKPIDLWTYDSKALVREKFEKLVYACVHELILNDQPERVDVPEGWIPERPVQPAEWPPRQFTRSPSPRGFAPAPVPQPGVIETVP